MGPIPNQIRFLLSGTCGMSGPPFLALNTRCIATPALWCLPKAAYIPPLINWDVLPTT